MQDVSWRKQNQHYLDTALTWLRLRLAWYILEHSSAQNSAIAAETESNRAKVAQAAATMARAQEIEPPPAMDLLVELFDLSTFEQSILLLCAALELDPTIADLCAHAQNHPERPYPTFALVLKLFDESDRDVFSPEAPLRYWQLIEINQPRGEPLVTSPLSIDERIFNFLRGLNYLDDRLAPFFMPLELPTEKLLLARSQTAAVEDIAKGMIQFDALGRSPLIQLLGSDDLSKQLVACACATVLDLDLYRLPAQLLPARTTALEQLALLWQRDCLLRPMALYIDTQDNDSSTHADGQVSPLDRFLARSEGLFFLDTCEERSCLGRTSLALPITRPTSVEQRATWEDALNAAASNSPALLASQFSFNLPEIYQISQLAQTVTEDTLNLEDSDLESILDSTEPAENTHSENGKVDPLPEVIWQTCLRRTRPRLDRLAQPLEPKATLKDLVLPQTDKYLLYQLADQVQYRSRVYDDWGFRNQMNRGLGISALFAGPSGTGKTMAAEGIAKKLNLNLYRIDLSAVVSKYIGETEKNLSRLFDAAEEGGSILFFDEADALFGKRSEVKDAHDRYANIEINYLLQRIESYRGLAILATNQKSALDRAFLRRLRFIIDFPFPDRPERQKIWQKVFPKDTPRQDLDYKYLAKFNLTGGSIHNIALNAAFLAAKTDEPVTMPVILAATRNEFRKLNRPIDETEFIWPKTPAPTEALV